MHSRLAGLTLFFLLAGSIVPGRAQDAGIEYFEKKVRPVLVQHCYECHSASAKKIRAELLLDSRDGIRKGGVSGPAIEPGHPDKSLLIKSIHYTDEALKMPRQGKLPAEVIADLEAWVKMGAPDPRDKTGAVKVAATWEEVLRSRRSWWSLQPVQKLAVPQPRLASWSQDPIDRFILARLEEKGLKPGSPTDPHTLLRRLSLVLTGLPPAAEDLEAFVKEYQSANPASSTQNAIVARWVDRLLASPHFGERWARHWMDVVRFTETHGNEWNYEVHHAWRYRDYLTRAFNDDVPYDQLVREHIAGDLLPKPRWNRKELCNESVIGTAFYRFGEVNHDDCIGLRQLGYDLADNQIDTLTKTFQALTVACARCHDHKLDAVSTRDYHGLLGVLRSSRCVSHTLDAPEINASLQQQMRDKKAAVRRELAAGWLADVDAGRLEKWFDALGEDKTPLEHPLAPWRLLVKLQRKEKQSFADAWKKVTEQIQQEDAQRTKFNEQNFTLLADFRTGTWQDWQVDGQGLRERPAPRGDCVVATEGEAALAALLPPGAYTHALSDKLNGTLRSPVLTTNKKHISFQVLGQRSSAVRLVSNNCQLNYRNFHALTSSQLHWVTFPVPQARENLRVYAELMTMFDNPKFPDPLGTLGGDKVNYRMPWEKAAANPRSFFGVTQVVLHDPPAAPRAELTHLRFLWTGPAPASIDEFRTRYVQRLQAALRAWSSDQATEDDMRWLDAFVVGGFLSNRARQTPRLAALITEYRQLDAALALPRIVPGMADCGPGFDQPIFQRGDCFKPGEPAARRFVEVLSPTTLSTSGSGRRELAELLASRDNPLTARVMVNRIWHHLFGAGLVRTVNDFGHVGDAPSHPELLDYLALRFMDDGWSIKRLIRALVLTQTFQLTHQPGAAALIADPDNRLLEHYPARRMEAEAIRDAILATSGRLDRTLYGMSIPAYRDKDNEERRLFRGPLDGLGRRSLYIKVTLMEAPRFLEAFNLPGGKVSQGRRDVTHVPAQALAMLNDPFVLQQAEHWSRRLVAGKKDTIALRVESMLRLALARDPAPAECERFTQFVTQVAALHKVAPDAVLFSPLVWRDVAHTIFNLQEFISIP